MKENVESTQNSMNSTIVNLKKEIISKFENFSWNIKWKETYDLYEIEKKFKDFENQFYAFRYKILTSDKYYEITSKRSGFVTH